MTIVLLLLVAAYAWCWWGARRRAAGAISVGRLASFLVGAAALWAALASPLARLDQGYLTGHMIQHLLIMTLAAPLLLFGEPAEVFALGRGARPLRARWRAPHPALCWLAGTLVVLIWHVPRAFELGMRWHAVQHATFLAAGLLFWIPVIRPWPIVSSFPRWSIPLYLFLGTLPCDALSAFLTFCGRVIYPHYCSGEGHCGLSSLEDQARAGALMWFWVTIAYLVPAALITIEMLSPPRRAQSLLASTTARRAIR